MKKGHEERGAHDRPQNRKRLPARVEHEGFGETELMGDPWPEQGTNEPEGDRNEEPAPASSPKRFADGTADRGDHDENDEAWDCQCHDVTFITFIEWSREPKISSDFTFMLDALQEMLCSVVHTGVCEGVPSLAEGSPRSVSGADGFDSVR